DLALFEYDWTGRRLSQTQHTRLIVALGWGRSLLLPYEPPSARTPIARHMVGEALVEKDWKRRGFAWSKPTHHQCSGPVVPISCSIANVTRRQIAAPA